MAKKILRGFLLLVLVVVAVVMIKVFLLSSKQIETPEGRPEIALDSAAVHLSKAIQIQTVSYEDVSKVDTLAFLQLHELIRSSFPTVMENLSMEVVNKYSLLFHWKAENPVAEPIVFLGHMDVVPVDTLHDSWDFPPFAGIIDSQFIYGRGALDDKLSVFGILEAAEQLLKDGYHPKQDIYFAFGHDEELTGEQGAVQLKNTLLQRGIKAAFILDEGLVVTNGMVPGVKKPVALIGISEKGYLTLKLEVQMEGGHSSMPDKENAVSVLAKAINALQEHPFKAQITPPVDHFIDFIGPEASFVLKMAFANRWLFENMILSTYQKTGAGAALVQSTISPTIFNAGFKENVVPAYASAAVNLRLLPGLKIQEVMDYFQEVIDDERVEISVSGSPKEASPVASIDHPAFQSIHQSIREIFPDALVAPSLVLATTDSRHYTELCSSIYKFLPVAIDGTDIKSIHGKNEKISLDNYSACISFYYQLMKKF